MKTKIKKTVSACALFFLGVFVLNLTACKKETMVTPTNQSQLQVSTNVQANAASSFTSNEKINTDLFVSIPCANGGAGEDVHLSGFLHVLTSLTTNGNNFRVKYHLQYQGISGVGLITGDKYQAMGLTQEEFNGSFVNRQFEDSYMNNFRIIGQGNGNNFLVYENIHIAINANGVVTTSIDNLKVNCK